MPNEALEKYASRLAARDCALAMRLLRGVLQNMALCDYYVSCFSSLKLNKIEPRVLDILRLSVYQLVFMNRIPHSAAVDEGVSLAAKYANQRASGFVNAVLRKVAEAAGKRDLPAIADCSAEQALSVRYSHPEWLIEELFESLGPESTELFLSANNADDLAICAQVNTLLANTDEVIKEFEADGVDAKRHEWLGDCVTIRGAGDITQMNAFKNGHIYIQDAAARLAVTAAGPAPGMYIIDGCAAPGGKSFASALAMENSGRISAFDLTDEKLRMITAGAERLGINIIETAISLMTDTAKAGNAGCASINLGTGCGGDDHCALSNPGLGDSESKADIVIADVPCSGFGVIRKKPEIRYKTAKMIENLPSIQKSILCNLSNFVKPGGILLYSTCTVLKRENEDVTDWFLALDNNYVRESFSLPHIGEIITGHCTLLPHIHGTDGFYICKLRRKNNNEN